MKKEDIQAATNCGGHQTFAFDQTNLPYYTDLCGTEGTAIFRPGLCAALTAIWLKVLRDFINRDSLSDHPAIAQLNTQSWMCFADSVGYPRDTGYNATNTEVKQQATGVDLVRPYTNQIFDQQPWWTALVTILKTFGFRTIRTTGAENYGGTGAAITQAGLAEALSDVSYNYGFLIAHTESSGASHALGVCRFGRGFYFFDPNHGEFYFRSPTMGTPPPLELLGVGGVPGFLKWYDKNYMKYLVDTIGEPVVFTFYCYKGD